MKIKIDSEIFGIIKTEENRQKRMLQMIPSENYASNAVRTAVGSILMNKYAEGQAGKRYYQGNENIDRIEKLCKERALLAFGLDPRVWGVNVQALSGSPANLAVYNGLISPGERIMAMYLPDGGHLSHGWQLPDKKITLVSKIWDINFYHVDPKTQRFDYDRIKDAAIRLRPKLLISGGTAYAREIDHKKMGEIASQAGAYYMADIAHEAGLVAAGVNTSPFPHAHIVTMTTHKTLRGPRGAIIFARRDYNGLDLISEIDASVFPGLQGGPHEHTIAGIAVALGEAMQPEFKSYAAGIIRNAQVLAGEFAAAGYDVVSGGTDKHLVLLDLRKRNISAWIAAWALEYANIIVNRNTVPNETGSSYYPSGVRLGTPALTTRGMGEAEMMLIAGWMCSIFAEVAKFQIPADKVERLEYLKTIRTKLSSLPQVKKVAAQVAKLTARFPIP